MTQLAEAFVLIAPDTSGFAQKLKGEIEAAVSGIKAVVSVGADAGRFREEVQTAAIGAAAGVDVVIDVLASDTRLSEEVRRAAAEASASAGNIHVDVEVDASRMRSHVAEAVRSAELGEQIKVDMHAQSEGLRGEVNRATKVAAVGEQIEVPIKGDSSQAETGIKDVDKAIEKLLSSGDGLSGLTEILKFGGIASGASSAAQALLSLAAGGTAVVSALAPLTGLLGVLPGALAGLVQGLGTFKLATSGIADAVKAMGAAESSAGKDAQTHADQVTAARERMLNADERVADARRSLATAESESNRSQEEDARRVAEARKQASDREITAATQLRDARESEAETSRRTSEQIATAERQQADNAERNSERVRTAERTLASAQKESRDAQRDLNRARADAVQNLHDLQDELHRTALDEEDVIISLAEAQAKRTEILADPSSTQIEKRRADLRVRQEQESLDEIRKRRTKNATDLNKIETQGIEGDDKVRTARERQQKAQDSQSEAARNLGKAEHDSTQQQIDDTNKLADVNRQAGRDRLSAARAVAKAEHDLDDARFEGARRVADAERQSAHNQETSARTIQNAFRSVERALHDQSVAADKVIEDQAKLSSSADRVAQAMAKLSPAGRDFATFLFGLKPKLDELKAAAQGGLLPGAQAGIENLGRIFPAIRSAVSQTAGVFGEFAAKSGALFSSGPFARDFTTITTRNAGVFRQMGSAALSVLDAFRNVTVAAGPLFQHLADLVTHFAESFQKFAQSGRDSGALENFFRKTADVLDRVVSIGGHAVELFKNIGTAAAPLGNDLLRSFDGILQRFRQLAGTAGGQNALRRFFDDARAPLHEMALLIGDIGKAFIELGRHGQAAEVFAKLRTEVLPALVAIALNTRGAFLPLIDFVANVLRIVAATSGPLGLLVGTIARFSGAIATLLEKIPGLGQLVGAFLLFRQINFFSGLATQVKAFATGTVAAEAGAGKLAGTLGGLRGAATGIGFALGAAIAVNMGSALATSADNAKRLADQLTGNALKAQNFADITAGLGRVKSGLDDSISRLQEGGPFGQAIHFFRATLASAVTGHNEFIDTANDIRTLGDRAQELAARQHDFVLFSTTIRTAISGTDADVLKLAQDLGINLAEPAVGSAARILAAFDTIAQHAGLLSGAQARALGLTFQTISRVAAESDALRQQLTTSFSSVDSFIRQFSGSLGANTQSVSAFFQQQVTDARTWATSITELIRQGVDLGIVRKLAEAGPQAGAAAASLLAEVRTKGVTAINQTQSDVKGIIDQVVAAIAAADIKQHAGEAGRSVGTAIGQGVSKGLEDYAKGSGNVKAKTKSMVDRVVDFFKEHAIIASPSKLFAREVGEPIGAGVALGILNASPLSNDAARRTIRRAVNNLGNITGLPSVPLHVNATGTLGGPLSPAPLPVGVAGTTGPASVTGDTFQIGPIIVREPGELLTELPRVIRRQQFLRAPGK